MFVSTYLLFVGWRFKNFFLARYTLLFFLVSYFRLFRGERQSMLIFFIISAFLFLFSSRSRFKWVFFALSLAATYLFLDFWASFRWIASSELNIVTAAKLSYEANLLSVIRLWDLNRLNSAFYNLVWVSDLVGRNIYLNGDSFLNLFSQMIPSFLASTINFDRPPSGSWILGRYFNHGGHILFSC